MNAVMLANALLLIAADDTPKYARPELLVEIADLANPAYAQRFRILDVRAKTKYDAGHLHEAAWVNLEAWSKAFATEQDPAGWSQKIGVLGIDGTTKVVIYDDAQAKDAARVWFILRYWGVRDARLLNGGWPAWVQAKLPVTKEEPGHLPTEFKTSAKEPARLADKAKVLDILKDKKTQIIDTRSEQEFCGDDKHKNKRGGAIPGAVHLEWSEAVDPKTKKFKSAGDLTRILNNAGIDLAKPAVTYCQSGGRAAMMAFTLELMGAKEVANYCRGWSEWGNDETTPIETPKKK